MDAQNELKYIHSTINDLLKFGEAKHGGLVVLNSGFVIGLISSYRNIEHLVNKPMILLGCIFFGASIFFSIVSLFPNTTNIFHNKKEIENPNIYFFRDLANLDKELFISIYKQMDTTFNPTKFHTDLINQILVIARITRSKFSLFKIASYLTALGIGVIGISTIIEII